MSDCARCGHPLHIGGGRHPNAEDCIKTLKATLVGAFQAGQALRDQRDEALALLGDVYEALPPICTGRLVRHDSDGVATVVAPCGACLWCRVRAHLGRSE